jgi:hypothetical protein
MAKITLEVSLEHRREVRAAQQAGEDIAVMPAGRYLKLLRAEYLRGQYDVLGAAAARHPEGSDVRAQYQLAIDAVRAQIDLLVGREAA